MNTVVPSALVRVASAMAAICVLCVGTVGVRATEAPSPPDPPERQAHARLDPVAGSTVRGHSTLGETDDGVKLTIHVVANEQGRRAVSLTPDGSCAAATRKRDSLRRLGTINIDEDGRGTLEVEVLNATLGHDKRTLIGRAIVVHTDEVQACGNVQRPQGK